MKKIAVVGVQESIGREILFIWRKKAINRSRWLLWSPSRPLGNMVSFGEDDELDVESLDKFDFSGVAAAVFCVAAEVAKKYVPHALAKGVKVVDCSSAFFGDPDVPMIISGINGEKAFCG